VRAVRLMRDLALLGGLTAVVVVCVLVERFVCRPMRQKQDARAVVSSAVEAYFDSGSWALQAALDCALARPAVHALPATRNPATWQGDGARGAEAPVREQTEHPGIYAEAAWSPTPTRHVGVQVRGRISARSLVHLQCKSCGRDLLPIRRDAILYGCPCSRIPAVRRLS
jgi:hypothetical protein